MLIVPCSLTSSRPERAYHDWLHEGSRGITISKHFMIRVQGGWVPSSAIKTDDDPDSSNNADEDPDSLISVYDDGLDGVTDDSLEIVSCRFLSAQEEVDLQADSWAMQWGANSAHPVFDWSHLEKQSRLPNMTIDIVRAGARTFPARTGLGWDKAHPRSLLVLPDEPLVALIRILIIVECLGLWPTGIGVVIIFLIPKSDGGRRPIGLMPSPIRLWMRIRLDVARRWQLTNERNYFCAGPLKGATVAAWKQAARAELATFSTCDEYANNLLDLVKAFDRVPHSWLVKNAAQHEFPLRTLRVCIVA